MEEPFSKWQNNLLALTRQVRQRENTCLSSIDSAGFMEASFLPFTEHTGFAHWPVCNWLDRSGHAFSTGWYTLHDDSSGYRDCARNSTCSGSCGYSVLLRHLWDVTMLVVTMPMLGCFLTPAWCSACPRGSSIFRAAPTHLCVTSVIHTVTLLPRLLTHL